MKSWDTAPCRFLYEAAKPIIVERPQERRRRGTFPHPAFPFLPLLHWRVLPARGAIPAGYLGYISKTLSRCSGSHVPSSTMESIIPVWKRQTGGEKVQSTNRERKTRKVCHAGKTNETDAEWGHNLRCLIHWICFWVRCCSPLVYIFICPWSNCFKYHNFTTDHMSDNSQ